MTYQLYTEKYLLRKGISFCKMVAKERGISPVGDKRQLFTWTQAIMQWQETKYQPVEVVLEDATITYDDSLEGSCEGEYCVEVCGEVIRRFRTYIKAESFCKGKYNLVSPQEEAQLELEQELEQQGAIASEVVAVEVGDEKEEKEDYPEKPHYSVREDYPEKPHYSVREDYPERDRNYKVVELDFGTYDVLFHDKFVDSITRDFELGLWWVGLRSFEDYSDAEQFIIYQHREGFYDDERSSGRMQPKIVTEFVGNMGTLGEYHRVYSNSPNGKVFLGTIYFKDYQGWSLNGKEYHSWQVMTKMLLDPVTAS